MGQVPAVSGRALRWIALGGLAIGTLDLLYAWGFWAAKGVTLPTILRSIGEGWYGKASHQMGASSAIVGALSHYFIAICFVLAYWLAARRVPALIHRPWRHGLAYGALLYAVMNFVVLPLSAAGMPTFDNPAWVGSGIVVHALLGVMCAFVARASTGPG